MGEPSRTRRHGALLAAGLIALTACTVDSGVIAQDAGEVATPTPETTMPPSETIEIDAIDETPTTTIAPPTATTAPPATTAPAPVTTAPAERRPPSVLVSSLLCIALLGMTACGGDDAASDLTAPPEPAVCTVSELLVPACGAWFGASTPSVDGAFDYTRGLAEYASVVDEPPDILRFYQRGAERFPNAEHRALAERPGQPRSILHFSWKPALDRTWREIADGAADDAIDLVAASMSEYPHLMFFTVHHEPENDVIDEAGSGMTTADYVDMYRYVVTELRARGVDNLVYVMSYIGFERWVDVVDELYPGDDVVDWIAWDPYAVEEIDSFAELVNTPSGDWPGFYEWAVAKAPGTPLMLAEWGFNLPRQPWATEVLADAAEVLPIRFPAIRALVYWNDNGSRFDTRLVPGDAGRADFVEAYQALASDRYFNRMATSDVPTP